MSHEKSSRRRVHSRRENSNSKTMEKNERSNYSYENEYEDRKKCRSSSTSSTSLTKNRTTSGSSVKIRNGGHEEIKTFEQSEDEANSDNLTYTKNVSDTNRNNVTSRSDTMRKVEDYLMRQETEQSEMIDNDRSRTPKPRKSKKRVREKSIGRDESKRIEQVEATDDDDRSIVRQNGESPRDNTTMAGERRRWKKYRNDKSRTSSSKRSENDEGYDEDADRSIEKFDIESSNENFTKQNKQRRRWKKQRNNDNRDAMTNETFEDDNNDGEVCRRRSKKHGANEPRISARRKRRRSKVKTTSGRVETADAELPITEVLRKAQEDSRNRFDETLRFPELTTDTIYVQRGNGFSAVKITGDRGVRDRRYSVCRGPTICRIRVAILAQKFWSCLGLIHQGLLAGMALMHILLIQFYFELSTDFIVDYSIISELYTNIFSYLVTISIVSIFDKFDLGHLDLQHVREIYVEHSRSFLAVPIYMATFCLHQLNLLVDDKISLLNYEGNSTWYENNSTSIIQEDDIVVWRKIILAKDGLAVIAWLFVALGPRQDTLLTHLKTMDRYEDTPPLSPALYRRTQR